jgi:hypothetical protein
VDVHRVVVSMKRPLVPQRLAEGGRAIAATSLREKPIKIRARLSATAAM